MGELGTLLLLLLAAAGLVALVCVVAGTALGVFALLHLSEQLQPVPIRQPADAPVAEPAPVHVPAAGQLEQSAANDATWPGVAQLARRKPCAACLKLRNFFFPRKR